jgi:hypothetical protein
VANCAALPILPLSATGCYIQTDSHTTFLFRHTTVYWGRVITNDTRQTREIQLRITTVKTAFNRKKTLFTSKSDSNLSEKLVECYIWSLALNVLKHGHFGK